MQIGQHSMPNMMRSMKGLGMQSGYFPVPLIRYKFGKNTGDVAYDSSPEGNDGDIKGPSWAKGYLGPGLSYDGLDDCMTVPDLGELEEFSILFSFYMTGRAGAWRGLFGDVKGGAWKFISHISSGNALAYAVRDMAPSTFSVGITFDATQYYKWYVVAFVYSSIDSYAKLHVNGALKDTITLTSAPTIDLADARIGMAYSAARIFQGIIDEFYFYDVPLTDAQVQQLSYGIR